MALDGPIENHFGPLSVIAARGGTICELAQAIAQGKSDLGLPAQPENSKTDDNSRHGKLDGTVYCHASDGMARCFFETDVGVKKALEPYTSKELPKMAEAWRQGRSYATINLWNTL